MTDFVKMELDLVELIACDLFDAYQMPEDESKLVRNFAKPLVLIAYSGSDYSGPDNLAIVSQADNARFDIEIRASKRITALSTARIVATRLQGYKLPRFDKITLTSQGYTEGCAPNNWNYRLSIAMTGICMEQQPEQWYNLLKEYEVSEV